MTIKFTRLKLINKIRNRIERDSFPRLQMSLLVVITAAAGFLGSYTLLRAGMSEMWLRYFIAVAIAYLVFLLLLWLWLRTRAEDYLDISNVPDLNSLPGDSCDSVGTFAGEGGSFGGGGASGSFGAPLESSSVVTDNGVLGESISAAADADEMAIPLFALVILVALLLSALFVIYSAPVLFAELILDGVLAAGLYRRLRDLDSRHWLETAVRRTILPFLLTAMTVAAVGWAMGHYFPGTHSIGDVLFQK